TLPVSTTILATPSAFLRAAFSIAGVGLAPPAYQARAAQRRYRLSPSTHAADANDRPCVVPTDTQSGKGMASGSLAVLPLASRNTTRTALAFFAAAAWIATLSFTRASGLPFSVDVHFTLPVARSTASTCPLSLVSQPSLPAPSAMPQGRVRKAGPAGSAG